MGIFILFKIATRQKISKRLLQQIEQQIIGQTEVWNGIQISSVYVEVIESLMRFEIRTIILIIYASNPFHIFISLFRNWLLRIITASLLTVMLLK